MLQVNFNPRHTLLLSQLKDYLADIQYVTTFINFSGISKPRPLFRWTAGDTFEDQNHLRANRTEQYIKGPHNSRGEKVDYLKQGERMASIVEFVAQPRDNGRVYSCFAQNPTTDKEDGEAHQELNATVTIVVLCKFFFTLV